MKLISCYIENFGALSQKDYTFDEGLTSICQDNGAGKSTLLDFLKAMFYGMDTTRKGAAFADRLHYYPFGGGKFGGNVVFEKEGERYKIERFFDEKSETKDSCVVYKNNDTYTGFGDEIGKTVFGIDKESFERIVHVSAKEIEISSTTSMNTKLNGFLQGGEEGFDLSAAIERLEKASKEYKKAKAGNDKISFEKARIEELNEKIANAKQIELALSEKYKKLKEIAERTEEIDGLLKEAETRNTRLNEWERYQEKCDEVKSLNDSCADLEKKYPFGVPSKEDVANLKSLLSEREKCAAQVERKTFTEEDEERLVSLSIRFEKGTPSESEIGQAGEWIDKRAKLQAELGAMKKEGLTDEELRIKQRFNAYLPPQNDILEIRNKVKEYKELKRQPQQLPTDYALTNLRQNTAENTGKIPVFVAGMGALSVIIGIVLLFVHMLFGIALIAVGIMAALAGAFLYLNGKTGARIEAAQQNAEQEKTEKRAEALQAQIQAFLVPFGYASEEGVAFDFATFESDLKRYQDVEEQARAREAKLEETQKAEEEFGEKLAAFYGAYDVAGEGDLQRQSALTGYVRQYTELQTRKADADVKTEALQQQINEIEEKLQGLCQTYGWKRNEINADLIASDAETYVRLRKDAQEKMEQAAKFKQDRGLIEKPADEKIDVEDLHEQRRDLNEQAVRLSAEVSSNEEEAERLDDYENEKQTANENLQRYTKKYRLLTSAVAFLKGAEQNLKDKYVKPVKDEFLKYSALLESTIGEKVEMSKNFEVSFERNGALRSEKHLSAGQRSICALCFRLAMVQNMYVGEKPFLLLDDPFVHLDKAHLQKAKTLIGELAKDIQIVYLTCHESRSL